MDPLETHRNPECKACSLSQEARSICIPSRGSKEPKILFVGQAPGEQEDRRGKAFVGPAGIVLNELLRTYGLSDFPIRITNAVRCYPPGDAKPTAQQIKACRRYLRRELDYYRPELVVTLGAVALYAMVGKSKLGDYLNELHDVDGQKLIATYHPAALLHDSRAKAVLENGFDLIRRYFQGERLEKEGADYELIDDRRALRRWMDQHSGPFAFDYETTHLRPLHGDLRCVAISARNGEKIDNVVLNLEEKAGREACVSFLRSDTRKIVHNAVFEVLWSQHKLGQAVWGLTGDTMLREYLLNELGDHSLEGMATGPYGLPKWDTGLKKLRTTTAWQDIPLEQLFPYCAGDSEATLLVHEKQEMPEALEGLESLCLQTAETLATMEQNGIQVDVKVLAQKLKEATEEREQLWDKLNRIAGREIDWNGRKEKLQYFFDELKLPIVKETSKGSPSCDKEAMEMLRGKHPIVKHYIDYGEAWSWQKFLKSILDRIDPDGCVRSHYKQLGTVTGRLSSEDPNHQNVRPDVRSMYTSRFDGGYIVQADHSQLELRLSAALSREPKMLHVYSSGGDLHHETAVGMFDSQEITEEQRKHAKRVNFSVLYGTGPKTLASQLKITKGDARRYLERFRFTYPILTNWMRKIERQAEVNGYVDNALGRRRHLPDAQLSDSDDPRKWRALRQAVNFVIQSFGSDVTCWGMTQVNYELKDARLSSLLVAQVHDSILIDCHPKEVEAVKRIVIEWMERRSNNEFKDVLKGVDLKVDLSVGKNWGELEEVCRENKPRRRKRVPRKRRRAIASG